MNQNETIHKISERAHELCMFGGCQDRAKALRQAAREAGLTVREPEAAVTDWPGDALTGTPLERACQRLIETSAGATEQPVQSGSPLMRAIERLAGR
jgi:hypothetical protein